MASTPVFGRRLVDQARRLDTHPNTLIRHIKSGVKLRDGSRLRLHATLTPGGWRITDLDVDLFYATLTTDRLGDPASTSSSCARAGHIDRRAHERAERELQEAGF